MNSDTTHILISATQSLDSKLSNNDNTNVRGKHKHSKDKCIIYREDDHVDSSAETLS